MGITVEMVVGVLVLTVLAILLTGPGMWSEKWGWRWLSGRKKPTAGADEAKPTAGSKR